MSLPLTHDASQSHVVVVRLCVGHNVRVCGFERDGLLTRYTNIFRFRWWTSRQIFAHGLVSLSVEDPSESSSSGSRWWVHLRVACTFFMARLFHRSWIDNCSKSMVFIVGHIYCEGNTCAYRLASHDINLQKFCWWEFTPTFVSRFFVLVKQDLPCNRFS